MKKIDYAINNLSEYWSDMDKKELIIEHLCPDDFNLNNADECKYFITEDKSYCKECWNKEINEG